MSVKMYRTLEVRTDWNGPPPRSVLVSIILWILGFLHFHIYFSSVNPFKRRV